MRLQRTPATGSGEPRYDAGTLRKVAALATQLQRTHQETLTAQEIELVGTEAGLEPAFIRRALEQLTVQQPPTAPAHANKAELRSLVAAFTIPLWWSLLTALGGQNGAPLMALLTPWPLAVFLGFLTGKKKLGLIAGVELLFLMTVVLSGFMGHAGPGEVLAPYFLIGAPLAGGLGWLGASFRQRRMPRPLVSEGMSRQDLLNLLFTLQRQLEGQKQHRAFLSVDVVGSSEMKRSEPELAVEHSFGLFRIWVEEIVHAQGGEMQSAAGDGMMALFPTDAGAVRAARQLQEGMPRFNAEQNRLPMPFRMRCGVSAGAVATEEGVALGHLQSPVIDRAAALQKRAEPGDILVSGEVTAAALKELGGLAALPEPIAGEPAFSWRAARPPLSSS